MQSFEQVSIFNSCIPSMSSLILDNTVVNLYLSEQMLLLNDRLTVQLFSWGYRGGSPTAVRPSDPALCGSCPLVTPYYCRLGDLLCFMCVYRLCVCIIVSACVFVLFPLFDFSFVASFSTLILLVGSFDL